MDGEEWYGNLVARTVVGRATVTTWHDARSLTAPYITFIDGGPWPERYDNSNPYGEYRHLGDAMSDHYRLVNEAEDFEDARPVAVLEGVY